MRRAQLRNASEQIVARDDKLESELGMHFLVAHRHVLDRGDEQLQLFFRFFELLVKSYDLLECRYLLFWLPRLVERRD